MTFESPEDKQKIWAEKVANVRERLDRLGGEMDPQIIETVAALNLLEIPTSGSCEGHLDKGIANPWVDMAAPGEPEERFENEASVRQDIAKKYGIPIDKIGEGDNKAADGEFWKFIDNAEETEAYRIWETENRRILERMADFISEFYSEREADEGVRLEIQRIAGAAGRVMSGPEERGREEKDKDALRERLARRQAEMRRFTESLKKKFFES